MIKNFNKKLLSTDYPYFHFLFCSKQQCRDFISVIESQHIDPIVVIEGNNCRETIELFEEFATKFQFPVYFGYNWDALDECMNDLDWLEFNNYCVLIKEVEKVLELSPLIINDFFLLLERAALEWSCGRDYDDFPTFPKPFHLIFQTEIINKNKVISMMDSLGINKKNIDIITDDFTKK